MSSKPSSSSKHHRRSGSPSQKESSQSHRDRGDRGDREKRRPGRRTRTTPGNTGQEMGWTRASRSPTRGCSSANTSRDVASRQLMQAGAATDLERRLSQNLMGEASNRSHRTSITSGSGGEKSPVKRNSDARRESKIGTATAVSREVDQLIAQYREHCDIHMATLLELKNNITTTEKTVVTSTEQDKEFKQVRMWYSALVEKHTKLQKEHQKLQEEHMALQEKYMNLKQASKMEDSFANFDTVGIPNKKENKKGKKEGGSKGLGEIVWERAGKIKNKLHTHQQLQ